MIDTRITPTALVKDISTDLQLLTDTQDVAATLEYFPDFNNGVFHSLLVDQKDGEYTEVWAMRKQFPGIDDLAFRLR